MARVGGTEKCAGHMVCECVRAPVVVTCSGMAIVGVGAPDPADHHSAAFAAGCRRLRGTRPLGLPNTRRTACGFSGGGWLTACDRCAGKRTEIRAPAWSSNYQSV